METLLFVHGTGVREPVYSATFGLIQQALHTRLGAEGVRLEPCYWGGPCGAKLNLNGASVPNYDATMAAPEAIGEIQEPGDYEVALWALLYSDPLAEVDLLALTAGRAGNQEEEPAPGQEPPGAALDEKVKALPGAGAARDDSELSRLLEGALLRPHFASAVEALTGHPAYSRAIAVAREPLVEFRAAFARALVALAARRWADAVDAPEGSAPPLDGTSRDRIAALLIDELGGGEMGLVDWVKEKAGRLVAAASTRYIRRRRGSLSSLASSFAADILLYQARPQSIRAFFRDAVAKASAAAKARGESGDVTVIAHSLGGVAAVDALIDAPLPAVKRLITVGSQSGLFYELGALPALEFALNIPAAPRAPLPDHFPERWLNVYDEGDFLSYLGVPIFGVDRVRDVKVDNGQPFPESHSAYWANLKVWDAILEFLRA